MSRPATGGGRILVAGSINMDIVSRVGCFPVPGETLAGRGTSYHPGGKGANQAAAAARAGAACSMLGAVGSDPFGDALVASLEDAGVGVQSVLTKDGTSGLAIITVSDSGENHIVLSEGANGRLSAEDALAEADWSGVYAVLLQNEIPWATNEALLRAASEAGVRVWLNPAPARDVPAELLPLLDTLIVNETEAAAVSGLPVSGVESARAAADELLARGARRVVVTLGEQGCFCADASGLRLCVPACAVEAVDTTAAGDTFIGAFAAASAAGTDTESALRFAAAAAAIAVTRSGAQGSIPSRDEIEAFLAGRE
ncbi:ribokinase [Paenibacillus albicereus]|uniref:Ribokinase n=1 Tax=Paenibacillus albicereus TaxID=2726185 RepID=A0A6H2GZP5_9BACL|nr:ribokinase [Paenibacillus albicereus]QJC52578.1 ribokinase [Paenibacillus albicereus]